MKINVTIPVASKETGYDRFDDEMDATIRNSNYSGEVVIEALGHTLVFYRDDLEAALKAIGAAN